MPGHGRRSAWATCGSGPSAPPTTPSVASATSTATTSGATWSTRRSGTTPSRASRSRSAPTTRWRPPGPTGTLEVPADAVTWDAASDTWVPVAAGHDRRQQGHLRLLASTSVSNWHRRPAHHASRMRSTPSPRASTWPTTRTRREIEMALAATSRPYLETFKGFRITRRRPDRGLRRLLALRRGPHRGVRQSHVASTCPGRSWRRWTTWSSSSAAPPTATPPRRRYNVPWLSLVLRRMPAWWTAPCASSERDEVVPAGVFQVGDRSLVTPEEATGPLPGRPGLVRRARTTSSSATGPSSSTSSTRPPSSRSCDAFRDPTYPFKAGDFALGRAARRWSSTTSSRTRRSSARTPSSRSPSTGPGTLGAALPAHRSGGRRR